MIAAVGGEAWARTGAVRWTFAGRHRHLWDRARGYARVRWDDVDARLRLGDRSGVVTRGGRRLEPEEARALLDEAYGRWVNDSFWLNPVVKVFDEGVRRELVELEGDLPAGASRQGLLVTYTSGGLTPGDAYLWIVDAQGRPLAWRMWVSIVPIGGLEVSWERWVTLGTGARVATLHRLGPLRLELTDVAGAADLSTLAADDPFAD